MYHILFIHLYVLEHLDCFLVLAIVNNAAVDIGVYLYFWIMVFSGYIPSSGIAVSYGSFIPSVVFFLKKSPISCSKILYDSPPRVMEIKTKVYSF